VIRGCVPKKLLVYASSYVKTFKAAKAFGWQLSEPSFDWKKLIKNKDDEIDRLNQVYLKLIENSKVELIPYHATFVDKNTVEANGEKYSADKILIATGSTPFFPEIEGIEFAISSNEALSLNCLPKKMTVMGAGYIAVEFACIFNSLGVEINLVYRGDKILRGFDDDVREFCQSSFEASGIKIITENNIKKISKDAGKLTLELDSGDLIEDQDQVLCATGRVANTQGLGLENSGIKIRTNGQLPVDKDQNCGIDSIFAVGDVCNSNNLTPVAIKEGNLLMDRWYANANSYPEYDYLPTTVFSQPEISTCGYTQQQAEEEFGELVIYTSQFRAMKYAMTDIQEKTFMKLIVVKKTNQVVGCHIVGADAGEMIQGFAVAIKQGITKAALNKCIGIHPSSAEELVTMK
jgi:glutathione reductase (NADPH)